MRAEKAIVLGNVTAYRNEGRPWVNFSIIDQWGINPNECPFTFKKVIIVSVNSPEITTDKSRIQDIIQFKNLEEREYKYLFYCRGDNTSAHTRGLSVDEETYLAIQEAVDEFNIKYGHIQRKPLVNITIDKGLFEI